jgi:hypothetical protein
MVQGPIGQYFKFKKQRLAQYSMYYILKQILICRGEKEKINTIHPFRKCIGNQFNILNNI